MLQNKLYIVSVPIGNPDDITLRALHILSEVDIVAAEDTRRTGMLLARHEIKSKLISCHEHNEEKRGGELLDRIEKGESVALVTDSGTPTVSDPGYRLVVAAVKRGIDVIPIPGVSAVITALSASGMPTDAFVFAGFPPKKKGKRLQRIKELSNVSETVVFYQSPRRLIAFLTELFDILGDRYCVLARELTKTHEEFLRGSISHITDELKKREDVLGECTLLVEGVKKKKETFPPGLLDEIRIEQQRPDVRISDLAKKMAKKYGVSRKNLYQFMLKEKKNEKR